MTPSGETSACQLMPCRTARVFGPNAARSKAEMREDTAYARLRTALDVFLGSLDVRRVGTSYAIDISYTSGDPNKAARIANAVADAYIQDQLKAASLAAQKNSEWLEARLTPGSGLKRRHVPL